MSKKLDTEMPTPPEGWTWHPETTQVDNGTGFKLKLLKTGTPVDKWYERPIEIDPVLTMDQLKAKVVEAARILLVAQEDEAKMLKKGRDLLDWIRNESN